MPDGQPQRQTLLLPSSASAEQAAAIAAAIEQFIAQTTFVSPAPEAEPDRWTQTAIAEGVQREDLSSWAWGDASLWE